MIVRFLIGLVLLVGGLFVAGGLALLGILMVGVWGALAAWAKLTGRPAMPFISRIDPRAGFERMYRRAAQGSGWPQADARQRRPSIGDVSDVEARPLER